MTTRVRRRRNLLITLGISATVVAGCSGGTTGVAPKTSILTLTTFVPRSSTAASSPPMTTSSPAATPYVVTATRLVGGDRSRVTYAITIPQLTGGVPAVAREFNESMRAAVRDIESPRSYDRGNAENQPNDFTIHIGRRVISSELQVYFVPIPAPAHGGSLISTITINADTARPITLSDVFADLPTGLNRLSRLSAELVPATRAGSDFERSGIRPTQDNFANWTASPDGMTIHFGDYQLGGYALGLIDITIGWDRLRDVLAPGMAEVLSS